MATILYLDTARLGRMCPEARAADHDFASLGQRRRAARCTLNISCGGASPAFPNLWPGATPACPSGLASTFFKNELKAVLAMPRQRQVFLANRSAQLVRLAARFLCQRRDNILVTDLEWPAYLNILAAECQQPGRQITMVPVRQAIFRDRIAPEDLAGYLAAEFRRDHCDGLFLQCGHLPGSPPAGPGAGPGPGPTPPAAWCGSRWSPGPQPRSPGSGRGLLRPALAGCHKWLRAYHPLGLALCCRPSVRACHHRPGPRHARPGRPGRSLASVHHPAGEQRSGVVLGNGQSGSSIHRRRGGSPHGVRPSGPNRTNWPARLPTQTPWRNKPRIRAGRPLDRPGPYAPASCCCKAKVRRPSKPLGTGSASVLPTAAWL